ncbi:MAG: chromate efflux transporter [Candidatus Brocadiales bacterium]|nr:chromate efflux transporter [Candidatus Brocadiales bacterium]
MDNQFSNKPVIHKESYLKLFMRFLKFGLLAWGGPVPQIAMLRQEMVEEEHWISPERFNRVLSVYQALPGPEAHELCVYFGMVARGRWGGFLAGLGFMLPGFLLMFALSWLYVAQGISTPFLSAVFFGFQAAVVAFIVRAVHRIGGHALTSPALWGIAGFSVVAELVGTHFLITLLFAGAAFIFMNQRKYVLVSIGAILVLAATAASFLLFPAMQQGPSANAAWLATPSLPTLFWSGLRSGLLTFGGAYTVIPFLQHDAVEIGRWMTNSQFLDGLALSGILPAPLIIFSTFVGYLGSGPLGALLLTVGIFLPAFAFTLIGHNYLERVISNTAFHNFLDGMTAGVVGLITVTTLQLFRSAIVDYQAVGIFALSLFALYRWKAKMAVIFIVLGAGIVSLLLK